MSKEREERMKVNLGGEVVDAVRVGFTPIKEEWNEYKLEDGTILKIKLVLVDVLRTEKYDPITGDPHYITKSVNIVTAIVPSKLKKLSGGVKHEHS